MLYPTLDSLIEKIGNRYLLVNVTAKRAREISEEAAAQGIKLTDKPVRLAVCEIAEGKYIYNLTEEQKADMEKLMGEESVDYFFTDPPYGDAIQYSELSYIWNAWMEDPYETTEEVIINPVQKKGAAEFNTLLCQSLDNIYRALKQEKYFTLCFQNKNSDIWKAVISHCKSLGLKLVDISIYNTYGFPFNKSWSNFSPKSDIYVTFQKTDRQLTPSYNQPETVASIVKEISAYMAKHGISADNNKLYDLTISYLIWALYLNEYEIDVSKFDIKKFTQIALDAVNGDEQLKIDI